METSTQNTVTDSGLLIADNFRRKVQIIVFLVLLGVLLWFKGPKIWVLLGAAGAATTAQLAGRRKEAAEKLEAEKKRLALIDNAKKQGAAMIQAPRKTL